MQAPPNTRILSARDPGASADVGRRGRLRLLGALVASPVLFAGSALAQPSPASPPATQSEVAELRAEVEKLREAMSRAGLEPSAGAREREARAAELAAAEKELAELRAALAQGTAAAGALEAQAELEARVQELKAKLAGLAARAPAPSLDSISERDDRKQAAPAPPDASGPHKPEIQPLVPVEKPVQGGATLEEMGLLPVEFTAFGDFFYRFERPGRDDFHVGSMELDASLRLSPYVNVSTAIPYSGEERSFGVAAFVIDCSLAGDGDGFLLKSKVIEKSGVSFGKFDVPIGIAYLQYPATENRFVTQPQAVNLTHAAWNDIGAQGYAVGKHFTAVGFVVNGQEHPVNAEKSAPSRTAAGGRLSAKVDELIDVGGSSALTFAGEGPVMLYAGGDAVATLGPLDVRGEYLLRHVKAVGVPEHTHGVYGQALFRLDPAFLVARYDAVLADSTVLDRRVAAGGGVEIFPQGEVRAVYEHSLDTDFRTVTLQLVGGSSFQPTGLRR